MALLHYLLCQYLKLLSRTFADTACSFSVCKSKSVTIPTSADIEVFKSVKLAVNFGKRCVVIVAIKNLVHVLFNPNRSLTVMC